MERQPGGDIDWTGVLAHRPADQREAVADRFESSGVAPTQVRAALDDMGQAMCIAASCERDDWADPFGGQLAVALLAAEVSALAASLNSRASAVRARAVDALVDEFSAVTVAARLGISRQKVYEISRNGPVDLCADDRGETNDG